MRKKDVKVGTVYVAKVSGSLCPVRLDSENRFGGWNGTNLKTNRSVRILSAARLRGEYKESAVPSQENHG